MSAVINFVKKSEMTKNGNVLLQMTKTFDWFFNEISNSYFKTMLICFIAFNLLFVNPTIFVNFLLSYIVSFFSIVSNELSIPCFDWISTKLSWCQSLLTHRANVEINIVSQKNLHSLSIYICHTETVTKFSL